MTSRSALVFALCSTVLLPVLRSEAQLVPAGRVLNLPPLERKKPPVYEIRCRGGVDGFRFGTVETRPAGSTGETPVTLFVSFNNSLTQRGAGNFSQGLVPGSCAFIDRPLNQYERPVIWFNTVANAQLKQALHGTPVNQSSTAAESFPDATTIPKYLESRNHYWSFFGAYDNSKIFKAVSHQPWKRQAADATFEQPAGNQVAGNAQIGATQPRNSIRIQIHYNNQYGLGDTSGAFGDGGRPGCYAFVISVNPSSYGNPPRLIGSPNGGTLTEAEGEYVCDYLIPEAPLDLPVAITVSVPPTGAWRGGTQPQPPPGQVRTILEPRKIATLTATQPRAVVSFEMIYAPPPTLPR